MLTRSKLPVRLAPLAVSSPLLLSLALPLTLSLGACQSAAITMWEKLGYAKREQLVEQVTKARDSQQDAKA
jgi:hypothetical protein